MPVNFSERERADVCSAVVRLIDRGGIGAVSLRAIAAESGISTGSLLHHLSDRDRILTVSTKLVRERLDRRGEAHRTDPLGGAFPDDPTSRTLTRAWLAFRELGRTHPEVFHALDLADQREVARLADHLGVPVVGLPSVAAMVLGLRDATCRPEEPLPHAGAVAARAGLAGPGEEPLSIDQRLRCSCPTCAERADQRARPRGPSEP